MAPHSSTLAWNIPWTEESGRLQSMGWLRVWHMTERLHFNFSFSCIGQGNGNPLQCSCLDNPRDGEPGGLPSMGSHRVRHDWSDLAAAAAAAISHYSPHPQPWATAFLLSVFISFIFLLLLLLFFLDSTYKLYLKLITQNIKSLEPVP